jgi:hypothetical protein
MLRSNDFHPGVIAFVAVQFPGSRNALSCGLLFDPFRRLSFWFRGSLRGRGLLLSRRSRHRSRGSLRVQDPGRDNPGRSQQAE